MNHQDLEKRQSLISIRLQMLIVLFGKKASEDTIESLKRVFIEALDKFPEAVISKVFSRAERELDRFPTPRQLITFAGEAMPSQAWRYNFVKAQRPSPITGMFVDVLIDPDPSCRRCRMGRLDHPAKIYSPDHKYLGICTEPVNEPGDEIMYKPQDCPEGQAFLDKLAEIAGRRTLK